jgi:predicted alpha/beta hydrolase family esterase
LRSTVLFVPGLRDHVADHWQTLLAEELPGSRTVPRRATDKLSLEAWVTDLDRAIAEIDGPVILAAHSAGCLMAVHWAQHHSRPVAGALLATPADVETPLPPGYPTMEELQANGWLPIPRAPLPFRSIVAASSNDPLAQAERAADLAAAWGSELVGLGKVGHLNGQAGFGRWEGALPLLEALDRAASDAI